MELEEEGENEDFMDMELISAHKEPTNLDLPMITLTEDSQTEDSQAEDSQAEDSQDEDSQDKDELGEECPDCDEKFDSIIALSEHYKMAHEAVSVPNNNKRKRSLGMRGPPCKRWCSDTHQ